MQRSENNIIQNNSYLSPTSSSRSMNQIQGQIGESSINNLQNVNSINIKKLVQQSNNYWNAERHFFKQDNKNNNNHNHNNKIDELDQMASSIENIANTPKNNHQNESNNNKFNLYLYDQNYNNNISGSQQQIHQESYCEDIHEWPESSPIDQRENIDHLNLDRKSQQSSQLGNNLTKGIHDSIQKNNLSSINNNNNNNNVPHSTINLSQVGYNENSSLNQQQGIHKQNHGMHRRIQSASGDIKTIPTMSNLNNLKQKQFNNNNNDYTCQINGNRIDTYQDSNKTKTFNAIGFMNQQTNQNNNNINNNSMCNNSVNSSNNLKQNNISGNTSFNNQNITQLIPGGFSQNKFQDISFSFSFIRKGATQLSKNLFQVKNNTLQIIDLSFNKFRDIPNEILEFPNLRVLKLDSNLIKVLNSDLFYKMKLEYFSISNNLLFEVPLGIIQWSECLKYLDISLNRIEDLTLIPKLKKLQSLHIQNNDFRYIPQNLYLLENTLQELSFDWFQYTNPPLQLRQSGLHGAKIIQKFLNFLKKYSVKDQSIMNIINKHKQNILKQEQEEVNFMEVVTYLSNPNLPYEINTKDIMNSNKSFTHKAADREEIGCLISLLEKDYELINAIDNDGHTPLSLSILNEKFFSAKTLISNGANVNLGGASYGTCLNLATIKYQYFLVQDLLKRGANPNATDKEGNTPLHYIMTIFNRDPVYSSKICDLLLQFKGDPNKKNQDGWAPIHLVARRGQVDAFKYIKDYNKELSENNYINNRLPEFQNFIIINKSDKTLQQQLSSETKTTQNYYYEQQNDQYMPFHINLKGGKEKQTPLHISCMHSCYDLVNLLLKNGADIFSRNACNKIPIQLCMRDNYLYKILKQKESEIFNKFYSLHRQILVTSPSLNTYETPSKNNNSNNKIFQSQSPQLNDSSQSQKSFQSQMFLAQQAFNKQSSISSQQQINNSMNQSQLQQQQQQQNKLQSNAIQVANIIQNNLNQLTTENKINKQNSLFSSNNTLVQQQLQSNNNNNLQSLQQQQIQNKPSLKLQQQITNTNDSSNSGEDCEIQISDDDMQNRNHSINQLNKKAQQSQQQYNKEFDNDIDDEYDISESQQTNRGNNFATLKGMNVKGNSKNYNFIQDFEKQFNDNNNNSQITQQKSMKLRGQLVRNSLLLSKEKFKNGEEQNECIGREEFDEDIISNDDACVQNDDDSINKQFNCQLPSIPNYFQQGVAQQQQPNNSNNNINQSNNQKNQSYSDKQSQDLNQNNNNNIETKSQPTNYKRMQFNEELDEDLMKEEEFFNGDIDESKSMFELINTKKKIMNQSLPYAPNNIQQLNYIQAVNRTNIQKLQAQKGHHSRSKSNIETMSTIVQQKQQGENRNKIFNNNENTIMKQNNSNQNKSQMNQTNNNYRGLIKNDGVDAPAQIITPQHISFFNYLLEKTRNMHEYYSVSLQNYKKGILSEFNTLNEKFRYYVIMMKLQIEYQNMVLHLINEKEMLQSILGETPLFTLGIIDQGSTNLMIMKMLLDIAINLKCENHSLLLIQKDYPTPNEYNFFGNPMNANNNISYWMRQYEETIHTITQSDSQDKEELILLVQNNSNINDNNQQNGLKNSDSQSNLNEEIKLCERENSILKENIIYQLGNFDFNESMDYLETEIKSSNTSIINAFESCQSFFRIRDSLYEKASNINDNKMRKNKIGMDFTNQIKPKSQINDSNNNKPLFSFPSSNNNNHIQKQIKNNSDHQINQTQTSSSTISENKNNQQFLKQNQQNNNSSQYYLEKNNQIIQPSNYYQSKNVSSQSIIITEHSEAQINTSKINNLNNNNNINNTNQQKPSISSLSQLTALNQQQQQQQSPYLQIKQQQQQSQLKIQQDQSNNMTDLQSSSHIDSKPTKPLIFKSNTNQHTSYNHTNNTNINKNNTNNSNNSQFINNNNNAQFINNNNNQMNNNRTQNNFDRNLAQNQIVLTEKALNKQISRTQTFTSNTQPSLIKDQKSIIDQNNQLGNNNNNQLVLNSKLQNKSNSNNNQSSNSDDDSNNNSFNLIAPEGMQFDSHVITNNNNYNQFQKQDNYNIPNNYYQRNINSNNNNNNINLNNNSSGNIVNKIFSNTNSNNNSYSNNNSSLLQNKSNNQLLQQQQRQQQQQQQSQPILIPISQFKKITSNNQIKKQ